MKELLPDELGCGWHLTLGTREYEKVLGFQRTLVTMREQGFARDTIITVEHPPVITIGSDGHEENYDQLEQNPIRVERGGDVTFHGPGQLVVYFIFNLARRGRDLHRFLSQIQEGIVRTLKEYNITADTEGEHTGVWVGKKKIASIGIAVKRWISFHGAAINLSTDLSGFGGINPCGLESSVMTTAELLGGKKIDMWQFAQTLMDKYAKVFEVEFYPISLEELAEDKESQSGGGHI